MMIADTVPLPERTAEHQVRQGLAEAQEFMGMLQQMMGMVLNSDRRDSEEAQALREMSLSMSAMVKDTLLALGKVPDVDLVAVRIRAGDYRGAAQEVTELARNHCQQVAERLARLQELDAARPIALQPGGNLASLGPAPPSMPGVEPPHHYKAFMDAHPAAHRLVASQRLQWLIEAGHDGAKAHLALLTAIVEYGDNLFPVIPEMRLRPPPGSPYVKVYDKVKLLLEHFENNKVRVNLLNPGRLAALIMPRREASIKEMIAGMQTPLLKKDAVRLANELRDTFETYVWKEFAQSPESAGLVERIREVLQEEGVQGTDACVNLLLNPHLDPSRCIADLGARIQLERPALPLAECLAIATRMRARINDYHQQAITTRAAALYEALGGSSAPHLVAILSTGNMADATGLALTQGNKQGMPDYIALLNTGYDGRVEFGPHQQPYFASNTVEPDGTMVYQHSLTGAVSHGISMALMIQPVRMDTERHYATPPTVAVSVPGGAVEIHFHKKGEKQLAPDVDAVTLPAGMSFDPEVGVLDLGPAYVQGEPFTVQVQVRSRDPVGNWEDFAVLVGAVPAPRQQFQAVDVFEPDRPAIKEGAAVLPEPVLGLLTHWLQQGAALEFSELAGGGVHPQQLNVADLTIDYQIDKQLEQGRLRIGIRSFTDNQPVGKYKYMAEHDANGNIGCSQDRSLAAAMWITSALRQACADNQELEEGLKDLESRLQMKLIQQPPRGTGKLQPLNR